MLIQDEVEFVLEKPIDYAVSGEIAKGTLLILKAPSSRNQKERIRLQQGFFQAITALKSDAEAKKDAGSAEIKGAEVLALMLSSSVDMVAFHEDFKRLITSGVCLVEGTEALTAPLYDKLHPDDLDRMLGEYLSAFILSSVLRTLSRS